ncbi:hypothetical protein BBD42_02145 [Paenibacillus sp. BIHB 4019]|uniref:Chemotaxis protein n=1 Tax=Paenibacillus sp. BIHB 4019 TaxID=1870819 RepID=A0A1B2DCG7_9BACL|nr:methyl-accepting chemotaxis protein [Paenibacillus sp. BIHB 4019]ANY65403.1 hypothetical protein BBD42_02145 [Paenibacillus sp. BIHB 4019]
MNSLFMRIFMFFSIILLIIGSVLGVTLYRASAHLVENSMGMQAQSVAERAASLVDTQQYDKLSAGMEQTDYYNELRAQLNDMREANGLKYLYTLGMREEGGQPVYFYVVDGAPQDVAEDDFSPFGSVEETPYVGMITTFREMKPSIGELTQDDYGSTLSAYVPIMSADGKLLGLVGADLDATKVFELMEQNRNTMIWMALAIFALSLLLVYLLARYLTGPLVQLKKLIARVGSGDLTVAIDLNRKDEVGQLAAAFKTFVEDTRMVISGIRSSSDRLLTAAEAVSSHSLATKEAGVTITDSIQQTSEGAAAQVVRAGEVTHAMEAITSSMQHIAHSAAIVASVSEATTSSAKNGEEAISAVIERMDTIHAATSKMTETSAQLEQHSGKIVEIISIMKGIAAQTNLLALNAGIEAARAGEEGRGFAVVASEVRKLATQSQESSEHVATLIAEIVRHTSELSRQMETSNTEVVAGLSVVQEAGASFSSIHSGIGTINERLHEVSAASEQLSAGSQEVAASIEDMESISRGSASRFEQVADASGLQLASMNEISSSAESLRQLSEELNALISRFKTEQA